MNQSVGKSPTKVSFLKPAQLRLFRDFFQPIVKVSLKIAYRKYIRINDTVWEDDWAHATCQLALILVQKYQAY